MSFNKKHKLSLGKIRILLSILVFLGISTFIYFDEMKVAEASESSVQKSANETVDSFREAKKLAAKVHDFDKVTFYCGCNFDGKVIDHQSCQYVPKSRDPRAYRLEWEHLVPASHFGQSFREWREGHPDCFSSKGPYKGRRCAQKVSHEFRRIEADLYNLVPEIGEVNALRSDLEYADYVPNPITKFENCQITIGKDGFVPKASLRGIIARTYLYMNEAYPGKGILSRKKKKMFEAWHKDYPVSDYEKTRACNIEAAQGNINRWVWPDGCHMKKQ